MLGRCGRPREYFAVADLMTDSVVFSVDGGGGGLRVARLSDQGDVHGTSSGNCAGHDELDEVSAIRVRAVAAFCVIVAVVAVHVAPVHARPPSAASAISVPALSSS